MVMLSPFNESLMGTWRGKRIRVRQLFQSYRCVMGAGGALHDLGWLVWRGTTLGEDRG